MLGKRILLHPDQQVLPQTDASMCGLIQKTTGMSHMMSVNVALRF